MKKNIYDMKNDSKCLMCGLCCQQFIINLSKEEYYSGKYLTIFKGIEIIDDFSKAKKYGANILMQQDNGACVYLKKNTCSIHKSRPQVCKGFFCGSKSIKYKEMIKIVENARLSLKSYQ